MLIYLVFVFFRLYDSGGLNRLHVYSTPEVWLDSDLFCERGVLEKPVNLSPCSLRCVSVW